MDSCPTDCKNYKPVSDVVPGDIYPEQCINYKPKPLPETAFQKAAREYIKDYLNTNTDGLTWDRIEKNYVSTIPALRVFWDTTLEEAKEAQGCASKRYPDCRRHWIDGIEALKAE